ncbi:hypothetical protein BV25DRAFT_762967 [Artomyces pyxidatus]|uniref:Uncharacterized protein n=1 Tax=Artomyces pyxidatus TaxID=48021 RepID=A0ACB8SY28_9AGAM|nr:hypothetical protein BV25DRAFT_762967 [Artomyces pyxidatus]
MSSIYVEAEGDSPTQFWFSVARERFSQFDNVELSGNIQLWLAAQKSLRAERVAIEAGLLSVDLHSGVVPFAYLPFTARGSHSNFFLSPLDLHGNKFLHPSRPSIPR